MFWLLSHKHYLVLSLLILTDIDDYDIFNRQINIHLENKVIGIKRCHRGMSV
jgi:hypothetical protein